MLTKEKGSYHAQRHVPPKNRYFPQTKHVARPTQRPDYYLPETRSATSSTKQHPNRRT